MLKSKWINTYLVVSFLLVSLFLFTFIIYAEEYIDPEIPDSWYQAPNLASELEITNFNESPMLKEKVKEGHLPSVSERLPNNPPVIEPYEDIGIYGGTITTWGRTLDSWDSTGAGIIMGNGAHYGRATPDAKKIVPYLLKDWEFSNGNKTITFYLREGMKWSDGHPFTADDFMFWWNYEANNEDLNPVSPENWDPPLLDVEKIDKYTVSFHYEKSAVVEESLFHSYMRYGVEHPAHYKEKFHPEFADEEELMEKVEEAGFENWHEYYQYMTDKAEGAEFHPERGGVLPTLRPYIVTERTPTYIIGERNPYFPFVDTEGNQLPYIDKIKLRLANDREMQTIKQATGESDLAGRNAKAVDIPLYKQNEQKYGFKTLMYTNASGSIMGIFPNLTHEDPIFRNIFQDVRFRRALSLGIDRNEVNDKVFFGEGEPRQLTHIPGGEFYEDRFVNAYIEYDPEQAKKLLDQMGMKDVNGNGFRETPDGEKFEPQFLYVEHYGPATKILELVKAHWEEIGINIKLNLIDTSLWWERKGANDFDITMHPVDVGVTDIQFAPFPHQFTPTCYPPSGPWPEWVNWYESKGETGMEPPKEIKQLIEWGEQLRYEENKEDRINAGKKLLEAQANNLWGIGIVGLTPKPVIINEKLRNIPKKGFWNDGIQRTQPMYPIQFYFEE